MKDILYIFIVLLTFVAGPSQAAEGDGVASVDEKTIKTREKAVLAKGEGFNYITDYPQDLYVLFNGSSKIEPLITYDWFPKQ